MRNKLLHKGMILALALSVMAPLVAPKALAADKPGPPLKLKVGDTAPNFSMLAFDGHDVKKVSLSWPKQATRSCPRCATATR